MPVSFSEIFFLYTVGSWEYVWFLISRGRPNAFAIIRWKLLIFVKKNTYNNFIFTFVRYNSARHGYPSKKPNWDVQYNVGYVILDQNVS